MKYLIGFLTGLAAGAAVALLFAPKAGEEIRAELAATAQTDWEAANAQLHKGITSMQAQLTSMQEQLHALRSQSDTAEGADAQ
jgi:gas vesicle protein